MMAGGIFQGQIQGILMTDVISDIMNAKAAVTEISVWIPIISSAVGGAMAIWGGVVTQYIIARREQAALRRKKASDSVYISAQLVVLLRRFLSECRRAATDPGKEEQLSGYSEFRISHPLPRLSLESVQGDWSVLPPALLLEIHELPRLLENIETILESDWKYRDVGEQQFMEVYRGRFRTLVQHTEIIVSRLNRLCGFNSTDGITLAG